MSTRRAVRPDSDVYRQIRRIGRRKRSVPMTAAWITLIVLLIVMITYWFKHRH